MGTQLLGKQGRSPVPRFINQGQLSQTVTTPGPVLSGSRWSTTFTFGFWPIDECIVPARVGIKGPASQCPPLAALLPPVQVGLGQPLGLGMILVGITQQ